MPYQTKLTLQSRITAYLIIMATVLTAIFTFLQINNQLNTLTRYNIYRAKSGVMLVKNALENALLETVDAGQHPAVLESAIRNLTQSGIAENVDIINQQGQIVATTNKHSRLSKLSGREELILKAFFKSTKQSQQHQPQIDKDKRLILQYVPINQLVVSSPETADVSSKVSYLARVHHSLGNINDALKEVYLPVMFVAVMIIFANVILSVILSKIIMGPLSVLNNATKEIAGGKLELRVNLPTGDEIEEVANTFNDMTVALVRMKERAENANPLTKLPGNNVIHEEIEKRLADKRKFVVVYSDLDNFKAFNDKYGIGAGDVAIKLTAQVMQESLKAGSPDDFLGHEGGDDFVLLTVPEKAEAVAKYITTEFDKRIRALYTKEDLDRGYIVAKSREGEIKQFPIMTLSLAGVSNISRPLTSYGEITNICASVKKVAKKIPGSVFVLDKMPEDLHPDTSH